ncbi:MAG TPA: MBL fold metallo-hydrolase [Gemmatimonadales bacterium]
MKLVFLGTRGYVDVRTRRHHNHSALEVRYRGRRVLIDCGEDWLGRLERLRPHAVVLTHSHPDHAFGLRNGAPGPVYATRDTWRSLERFPIADRHRIDLRRPRPIESLIFEAFGVEHSVRAPAVGYRITAGSVVIFYAPDLVYIREPAMALRNAKLYIGDGATLTRPLIRRRGKHLIGHTPVRTQLSWCQRAGVPRMIITHCGTQIVERDGSQLRSEIRRMGQERGVQAEIAFDGLEVQLRSR